MCIVLLDRYWAVHIPFVCMVIFYSLLESFSYKFLTGGLSLGSE